ncbi:MAG: TolC family protein, partial [Planctomycetaceae bacterium]
GPAIARMIAAEKQPVTESEGRVARARYEGSPVAAIIQASAQQTDEAATNRFKIPADLPGAKADPLQLPPFDPTESHATRRSAIESLFPELPAPVIAPGLAADASSVSFSLAQLQSTALQNSPALRTAVANVNSARGIAVQEGLYPNPVVGYEGDSLGTARTMGYNGLMITQEFVTAGKLTLAQSAAVMKIRAAEQDLRKARIDLASNVRRGYFNVLIAQEQIKYARAMAHLSEEVYQSQIDLVAAGEAAGYEPLQLRVLAVQARNEIVRAENELTAAWRGLAATLGVPTMAYHPLVGSAEMAVPIVEFDQASATLQTRHSDLAARQALISSACYNLELQRVKPIPNITAYTALQHDDTSPLNDFAANIQVGIPLPLFDRNQGNIFAAHAGLGQAQQELANRRNQLLAELATAHAAYATNRTIADNYRNQMLPDQVRVYRGVYERFRTAGGSVDFAQIVVSQQALGDSVKGYLQALRDQWSATVTLAQLMQVDDFFGMDNFCNPQPDDVLPTRLPTQEPQAAPPALPPAQLPRP